MFAFAEQKLVFLFSILAFYLIQSHARRLYPDERQFKLIWQFPCHVLCTFIGIVTHWQNWPATIYGECDYKYMSTPDVTDVCSRAAYAFFYAYWCAVLAEYLHEKNHDRDFYMMGIHHATTFLALLTSDAFGYRAIGLYVLFLHDTSDIFVMLLKICYKFHGRNEPMLRCAYIMCIIVWLYTRVYLFAFKLCAISVFNYVIEQQAWHSKECIPCIALFILAACNLIWTGMLFKLPFKNSKEVCDEYEAIVAQKRN